MNFGMLYFRHASKAPPSKPCCNQKEKFKKVMNCDKISMQDIRRFHQAFYAHTTKIDQDKFLLKHIVPEMPKRERPKGTERKRKPKIPLKYFVKTKNQNLVRVCSVFFQGVLKVSAFRVQRISKCYLHNNEMPRERRGGDKKSAKFEKRESLSRSSSATYTV